MTGDADASSEQRFFLNGVDALSGGYLTPPLTSEELVQLARDEFRQSSRSDREAILAMSDKIAQPHLGFDANLEELAAARWGLIVAADEEAAVRAALAPLVEHRAAQLGVEPPVFEYRPETPVADFLAQHGVAQGLGDVERVPYYLCLVGDPEKIPFRFQYELAGEYAVGRLAFDSVEGYHAYVEQLIKYETAGAAPNSRDVVFWATANRDDPATALSAEQLVQPLYDGLDPKLGFRKELFHAAGATREHLAGVFTRPRPPALLFTASHGLGFGRPDPQQPLLQGALVTQAWVPGEPITSDQLFGGPDLTEAHTVRGMVHYAFACYGAGTPRHDDFAHARKTAPVIAERPFVANLPRRLLERGALAFIGHVERAWGYSFLGPADRPMIQAFERALKRLLRGVPVGHALRDQYDRGVQLSSSLLETLNQLDYGKMIPSPVIARLWAERNDARAYCLLGDPGARLRVDAFQ